MITAVLSILILLTAAFAARFDFHAYRSRVRAGMIVLSGLLLAGFIAEPQWRTTAPGRYALITEGFREAGFNSSGYDSVYTLRSEDKKSAGRKWLSSVSMLGDDLPVGSNVYLYGFGTGEMLPGQYRWHNRLQEPARGLMLNDAPQQVETGKTFEFSVTAKGAQSSDSIQVYKEGRLWDRRELDGETTVAFTDRLNMQGPVSYDFEWLSGDSLFTETLNIRAVQPRLLSFGVLTYSPSFEMNYLAGHFGGRGHTVISRSRVGDGRFRFDAINASVSRTGSFFDNLRDMDLLVLDSREFAVIPASRQNQVKEAVQNGLDILLMPPQNEYLEEWNRVFSELAGRETELQPVNRLEERNWLPDILQNRDGLITPLPLLNINFANEPGNGTAIHRFAGNEPVSLRLHRGAGSVTGHLFYNTYRWLIEGDQETYNRFWSDYLGWVITLETSQIETAPMVPVVHQKMTITVTHPGEVGRAAVTSVFDPEPLEISVVQNPGNFGVAAASFWPRKTGWHTVEYAGQKKWFYVYGNEWQFNSHARTFEKTRKQIANANRPKPGEAQTIPAKIPGWIWLTGFLLLQIGLWTGRKVALAR